MRHPREEEYAAARTLTAWHADEALGGNDDIEFETLQLMISRDISRLLKAGDKCGRFEVVRFRGGGGVDLKIAKAQ